MTKTELAYNLHLDEKLFFFFLPIYRNHFTPSKGPIALAPIFLHKPERVAAITLICVIALQLLRLMEFNAKNQLLLLKEKLSGLLPNHLSTSNPSAVKMLAALSTIDILEVVTSTDSQFFLNKLSPLQLKILQLLDIPLLSYSNFLPLAKFPNSG